MIPLVSDTDLMPEDLFRNDLTPVLPPLETPEGKVELLYQDEYLIAVHKPAGLLVHPSWIAPAKTPHLVGLLKQALGGIKIHPVHRLDRATSGVMLFALDPETTRRLQRQFVERDISKTYHCLVRGWAEDEGTIDHALKPVHDKIADARANPDKAPKEAVTHFRCVRRIELPIPVGRYPAARYSLIEARPKTGRKHQIRRHFKHALHPLVGDTRYGEGRHNRLFREHFDCHRLLLMATHLQFRHPYTDELLSISARPGPDVEQLFRRIGLLPAADC